MNSLNDKLKSSFDDNQDRALVTGQYAWSDTAQKWNKVKITDTGEMKVDLNIDETGLATSAKQDTIINATIRDINNTDSVGDGSANATAVVLGYDRSGGKGRALNIDGNGRLSVDINSGIPTKTDGTSGHSPATGIGLIGFDSGTARAVACDSQGHLQCDILNQDRTANLQGFTDINNVNSVVRLKADSSGILQVNDNSGGGGGSSSANTYPTVSNITSATNFAGGKIDTGYIDLTNAKNILVNAIFTGNNTQRTNFESDCAFSMEFTDDDTNTVCYSGASNPFFGTSTLDAVGDSTGVSVARQSLGADPSATGEITGKFVRISVVNNNNSGTNTAYTVAIKVVLAGI